MFKTALLFVQLLATNYAFGEVPQACPQAMLNKTTCISGEKMRCSEEFDTSKNNFRYEWHAVNKLGQIFDVFSPYYRKLDGYTPAKCEAEDADATKPKTAMLEKR